MEPLFFKAENVYYSHTIVWCQYRFNGAAFFQSGKSGVAAKRRNRPSSFNGAAFFQSGKYREKPSHSDGGYASMEPLFFKAENAE